MPALGDLQAAFRDAILGGDADAVARLIVADGLAPEARLSIYRNHVLDTLTAVLESTFPVVHRLVDGRFFAYAADTYVRQRPPSGPCLAEYGATFPKFLSDFPPCRAHAYLPDVARLEWAMHTARHAHEARPLDAAQLSSMPAEALPRLVFRLDPSISFLDSPWPIDRIWRANQDEAPGDDALDLGSGGVHLEVRARHGQVLLRALTASRLAFRRTLAEGSTLEHAAQIALAIDQRFDLTLEIHEFLREELPIDVTIGRP
jgi:hypothetical protein